MNKELSEEAVSDVFFNLWTHRAKLAQIENLKAYIYTSARNTSLNYLDKERRGKAISLEDISVSLPINEICPESELISKELKEAIGRAIDHLPERCKLIYSLAKIEQLKYKEIAQILDISVKTIDHQLTIAIKKIGDEIQSYYNEPQTSEKYTVLLHLFLPK
jgi:RNA polymerase sigma-70 factor (ECF subfamily)